MGTRGSWGLRCKGTDKLTYNHFDSYPDGLGATVIRAVCNYTDQELAQTFDRLIVIDGETPPTAEEQARYADVANLHVSNQSMADWYCLLRDGQGEPDLYMDGTYDHVYDGNDFMFDSLFCEWAYVINIDTRTLEVYKGFNHDASAAGRYASSQRTGATMDYYGVALIAEFPFAAVRNWSDTDMMDAITSLQTPDEENEE